MLRKSLIYIRKRYYNDLRAFLTLLVPVLVTSLAAGVLVDVFLPFNHWWMILRTAILIPLGGSLFTLGYILALKLHDQRMDETIGEWVQFRLRYSLKWRRRMAVIIGAVLIVFVSATGHTAAYTFLSSMIVAIVIGLFAFIRPTSAEKLREELEVPDARDLEVAEMLSPNIKLGRNKKKDKQ